MILGREDLKPFKAWFQKTLPLVYDDSLTYQELLYKLIAKINEVVESQNQTNENFDESIRSAISKSDLFTLAVTPNIANENNYQ